MPETDEAFCEAFYDSHLTHALDAMREGIPYQINADGAFALIRQAAEDRRALKALAASTPVGGWEDISTAPKDGTPIIGWCVHSANEYHLKDGYLTTYGAHVEGLGHVGDGAHVLEWGGECDGDGDGYIPDWWFRVGSDFEEAANPTHWMPIPPPPSVSTDKGSSLSERGHER
jgi:hypothetical protein